MGVESGSMYGWRLMTTMMLSSSATTTLYVLLVGYAGRTSGSDGGDAHTLAHGEEHTLLVGLDD